MNIDLISVCVGVASSAVIPFVTWAIKKINTHIKYKSFKRLLLKEYVSQFSNINHSDFNNQGTIMENIEERIKDLDVLKQSLKNSNADCKYQMLRSVDYTAAFLYTLYKKQNELVSKMPSVYNYSSRKEEVLNSYDEEFENYGKKYIDTIDDFVDMKINNFDESL